MMPYYLRVLIALDQFANTILGGWPDETLSSRAGRKAHCTWYWKALAWVLNHIQPDHTKIAIMSVEDQAYVPPALRDIT